MATIYDRCRISAYHLQHIANKLAHSAEIARICVRACSASYALATDPTSQGEQLIPHAKLSQALAAGPTPPDLGAWFEDEPPPSFITAVPGGSALGILLGDTLIVAFRGTSNAADWGINLYGDGRWLPLKIPSSIGDDDLPGDFTLFGKECFVHGGFARVAVGLARAVRREVELLTARAWPAQPRGSPTEIYCGHSLGGALALLSSFVSDNPPVYTFGMPRVASSAAVAFLPPSHFRYVVHGDPVPNLPFRTLGFVHDGPAIRLDPYRDLSRPSLWSKFLSAARPPLSIGDKVSKGLAAVLAAEHDLGVYMESVDAL